MHGFALKRDIRREFEIFLIGLRECLGREADEMDVLLLFDLLE
jgi:hypothetical protein